MAFRKIYFFIFFILVSCGANADGLRTLNILNKALEGYRQGQEISSDMDTDIRRRNYEVNRINQEVEDQKRHSSAMNAALARIETAHTKLEAIRRDKSIVATVIQPDLDVCLIKTNKVEVKNFRKEWSDSRENFENKFNIFQDRFQRLIVDVDVMGRRLIDTSSTRSAQDTSYQFQFLALAQIHAINLKIIQLDAAYKYRLLFSCLAYLPPQPSRDVLESHAKDFEELFFTMELDSDYRSIKEILNRSSEF